MKGVEYMLQWRTVRRFLSRGVVVGALALMPSLASASPITYTYTGTATGSLDVTGFGPAAFVITALGDTANIGSWLPNGNFQNTHSSASIDLAGFGVFTFAVPTHTWIAEGCCMGFGKDLGANLLTLFSTAGLTDVGYGLDTAIGPISAPNAGTQGQFVGIATTGGLLTFSSVSDVTFEASTAPEVPEPATLLLFGTGLAVVARRGLRRRL